MDESGKLIGFHFLRSFYEAVNPLPQEEQGSLYRAIMQYVFDGIEPELEPILMGYFRLMRPVIDSGIDKLEKHKNNGKKGGNPNFRKGKPNPYYKNKDNPKDKPKISGRLPEDNHEFEFDNEFDNDIKTLSPDRSGGACKKQTYSSDFERFYQAYPKHKNKADAFKAFKKAVKQVPLEALLKAVETQKAGEWRKTDDRYIPYPATWLNRGGWEDETSGANNTFNYDYEEDTL